LLKHFGYKSPPAGRWEEEVWYDYDKFKAWFNQQSPRVFDITE
jgi:hypothetical protein